MKFKIAMVYLGFALTGIVTTMLGYILPLLAARWALNDAQAGRLFLAQFVASPTGALIASRVLSRWGAARTVPIGMLLIAAGVITVATGSLTLGVVGISLYGLGLGFALPSTNLLVVEMVHTGRAAALNLLNFMWTVGALAAPLAISRSLHPLGLKGFLALLAAAVLIVGLVEATAFPKHSAAGTAIQRGTIEQNKRLAFAVLSFLFLFLYVGIENGFAGWVPTFTIRAQHATSDITADVQSSFWGAILLGRLVAPLVLRKLTSNQVIVGGLSLATAGIALASASRSMAALETGVLLTGLGLSAVFPTAIAVFAETFGTGGAGSIVLGVCGLGGAAIPWLVGVVSNESHSLRLGLAVTLLCSVAAGMVYLGMTRVARQRDPDPVVSARTS
ncbi:MAG: MFS transporter [Terriglobales bacterium]